jgi:hypothetical protein
METVCSAHSQYLITSSKLENTVFQSALCHVLKLKHGNNDANKSCDRGDNTKDECGVHVVNSISRSWYEVLRGRQGSKVVLCQWSKIGYLEYEE